MRRLSLPTVVVVGALVSTAAWADARSEAKRHFKAGMAFIAEGSYDAGIDELLEAYIIKPHPNVLFNIAKAYQAAGRSKESLEYLRRYLATHPPDETEVQLLVARLDEQLRPAPAVPPPPLPEEPKSTKTVDDAALAKLEALTSRLERALQLAERRTPEAPGPAPISTPISTPEPETEATEEDFSVPYEETVVAASRRSQSILESPNAITIITGDEIRATGLQSLPELLRRVPGAEVMAMSYSNANVSFRGFNQRVANKVLLLVDGRPEYQDFLGVTQYSLLPIGMEEIERIEVVRGPGSALYGANAMLGVINIVTRTPGTGNKAEVHAWGGNADVAGASFVASGGEKVKYRASVGYQQGDKYTRDYDPARADVVSSFADPNLSLRSVRGNLTGYYAFNKDITLALSGGANRLFTEIYAIGLLRNFWLDGLSGYAKTDLTLGPVKLRFFWNHLTTTAGPQYEAAGQRSLVTTLEANVFDAELFFQKEFALGGRHLFAAGISGRLKRTAWSYIGPLVQELHAAVFVQDEWRIAKPLAVVASYRVDRHPLLDNGNPGYAQSPRVSVSVIPSEGHALRASFATAFRQPTFLESYTNIRVPVPGVNGASVLTQGNRALKPERLISFELGYRGDLARLGLTIDAAAYWNIVSDLIVLSAVNPVSAADAYDAASQSFLLGRSVFANDPATYNAFGGEIGVTWGFLKGLDVRGSFALQRITAANLAVCGRCTEAPAGKFNLGFIYRSPLKVEVSADLSFVSGTTWVEREPSPDDPTQIANLQNRLAGYTVINARVGYRFLNDKVSVALVGSQLGPNHQEHPFGNLISRRLMAQLTVTP